MHPYQFIFVLFHGVICFLQFCWTPLEGSKAHGIMQRLHSQISQLSSSKIKVKFH